MSEIQSRIKLFYPLSFVFRKYFLNARCCHHYYTVCYFFLTVKQTADLSNTLNTVHAQEAISSNKSVGTRDSLPVIKLKLHFDFILCNFYRNMGYSPQISSLTTFYLRRYYSCYT